MFLPNLPKSIIIIVTVSFHLIFGEDTSSITYKNKLSKNRNTIAKPSMSQLNLLGEKLAEAVGESNQYLSLSS